MENGELWHILAVGLPSDFARPDAPSFHATPDQKSGPALAARTRTAGAFVAVAHPEWSGLTTADARSIEAAHAIEVCNHGHSMTRTRVALDRFKNSDWLRVTVIDVAGSRA